jgi:POT family proton-dependent oligopeptide transporter
MSSIVVMVGVLITLATGAPVALQLIRHHPRGLFILFFTEMWERFSYYGMRGLLVFYLTQHFLFDDARASNQYGSYATLVYLMPLVGGVLADRYLGARKAVAFGALLLVVGHLTMAIEGPAAHQSLTYHGVSHDIHMVGRGAARTATLDIAGHSHAFARTPGGDLQIDGAGPKDGLPPILAKGSYEIRTVAGEPLFESTLYLALALIIMGVGFLKANISSIVGQLYAVGDPRRDPGFTLYYYGINLGAFWAAILCGYLGQRFGWSWGFGLAGAGMLAGYVTFTLGKPLLLGKGEPPDTGRLTQALIGPLTREGVIYLGAILGLAVLWLLVQHNAVVGAVLGVGAAAILAYVGGFMATRCDRVQRQRLFLAFVLIFGAVVFFTLFEQAATSLNLFADRNTHLALIDAPFTVKVMGHELFFGTAAMRDAAGSAPARVWIDMGFEAAQTQSFNAGFILIFAPIFAGLWEWLARRGLDPDPVSKFGLGLAQVGAGFLVLVWSQGLADAEFRLPLIVLAFTYLLHTTGELCLSPVGMSEITKLAPPVLISTLMAIWFLATSAAEYIGALIARFAASPTLGGQVLDAHAALANSVRVFQTIGWVGVGFGVAFLALAPLVRGWAHPPRA